MGRKSGVKRLWRDELDESKWVGGKEGWMVGELDEQTKLDTIKF